MALGRLWTQLLKSYQKLRALAGLAGAGAAVSLVCAMTVDRDATFETWSNSFVPTAWLSIYIAS